MEFVTWLVIGGLAGWIAGLLMRGHGFGVFANIVIGIVGAILGGLVFGLMDVSATGFWSTFFVALIGSILLLAIASLFAPRATHI